VTTTEKFPKGYGRMRSWVEREGRYKRALMWLAFRFDEAAADRWAREQSIKDQLATTGGVDPAQFPPTSPVAYLKFEEL
jgi:hypothetical protein